MIYEQSIKNNYTFDENQKMKVARDKVLCKCGMCGSEWESCCHNLSKGTGCPECTYRVREERMLEVRNKKAMEKAIKIAGDKWIVEPFKMEFGERLFHKYITIKCANCGTPRSINLDKFLDKNRDRECANCKDNSFSNGRSKQEIEVQNFIDKILEKHSLYSISSLRIIKPPVNKNIGGNHYSNYEIDIVIPDLRLAFEYNGMYWHSNKKVAENSKGLFKKSKYKCLYKTKECKKLGIKLIHLYEYFYIKNKKEFFKRLKSIIVEHIKNIKKHS